MECKCPACGGTTQADSDIGDFLVRCAHCRAFLKPQGSAKAAVRGKQELAAVGAAPNSAASSPWTGEPPRSAASRTSSAKSRISVASQRIREYEVLRAASSTQAREKMIEQARRRGAQQRLHAIAVVALSLIASLAIGAIVLEVRSMWFAPPSTAASHMAAHDSQG